MGGTWIDWLMILGTGAVAVHGLTYRDADGERPWVHLLFGGIALVFFLRTLFHDILGVW